MERTGLFAPKQSAIPKTEDSLLFQLGDLMMTPRSAVFSVVFLTVAFSLALFLRFAFDDNLPPGLPFITFFPAVLLTAVFAGIPAGIAAAVLGGLAAWYFFMPPRGSLVLDANSAVAMSFYAIIVGTELLMIAATVHALRRLRAEQKRSHDLARSRELMFNELQHRVSNNLATVAALLRMQAGRVADEDARQALAEAQVRIGTISRLQRRLHAPDIQNVDAATFLHDIAEDCLAAAGADNKAKIGFDLTALRVPHDTAIPLGLIVSELLMNAAEHGGTPGGGASLLLSMKTGPSPEGQGRMRVTVAVRDKGQGVRPGFRVEDSKSLGLGIARQFAVQLGGRLDIRNAPEGGAVSELMFDIVPAD